MPTTYNSDGTVSDFNTKYALASNGDTITIANGNWTWASAATTITKAIKIQGFGSGKVIARSVTSVTIGTGVQTFTLHSSLLAITAGDTLTIYRTGGQPNGGFPSTQPWMLGTVTSYIGAVLVMNITSTNGAGTHPLWFITTEPTALTNITHNAGSSTLFTLTENTSASIEFSGLRLSNGTGSGDLVHFVYTSSGIPILFHDCMFFSSVSTSDCIESNTNRGVIWNTDFVSTPFSAAQLAIHLIDAPNTSWTTASTIGNMDTDGTHNLYLEDCNFVAWLNATDFDNNARAVVRHSYLNNTAVGTHGPDTSNYGNRHFEIYNSTLHWDGYSNNTTLPFARMFYLRGGTAVVTDNTIDKPGGSDYGGKLCYDMTVMNLQRNSGPNPDWGTNPSVGGQYYHCPRQVGFGYVNGVGTDGLGRTNDTITYVGDSEPLYFWGNSGSLALNAGTSDFGAGGVNPDISANYIIANRDYFNDGTARPGYVKYAYPHPLRGVTSVPSYKRLGRYLKLSGLA